MSPFWTAFWILFIWVPIVTLWVFGLTDIFHRVDLSGVAKVLWVLAIVLVPIFGLLIYFIARPMDAELDVAYGYPAAPANEGPTVGEELHILAELHDRGKLSDEEYAEEKRRVLTAM